MEFNRYTGTLKIESIFSKDDRHRFVLRRNYITDQKSITKRKLCFILINPSFADELLFDKTNMVASNIAVKEIYNELVILNMYSLITKDKQLLNKRLETANHINNDEIILKECKKATKIIVAWGIDEKYDDRRTVLKRKLLNQSDEEKIYSIVFEDKNGKIYNPAHLGMYLTTNPYNFKIEKYSLI